LELGALNLLELQGWNPEFNNAHVPLITVPCAVNEGSGNEI
jgi:hypothetical protein